MTKPKSIDFRPVLKAQLKKEGVGRGWSLSDKRGYVHLRVRKAINGTMTCWSKNLPELRWDLCDVDKMTKVVIALHNAVTAEEPKSLDQAWAELYPDQEEPEPGVPSVLTGINWEAIERAFYRDRQVNGKQISDVTLKLERVYCGQAVQVLQSKNQPQTPYKLIDATITAGKWTNRPRARQQCVGAITRMLTYAVAHEGLSGDWILPQHQKLMLAGNGKAEVEMEIAILSDVQILQLLDAAPSAEWRNLLMVMAVYGLRPEEVLHLEPKINPETKRLQLWCSYRKAAGGRTTKTETKPRWLQAVPLSCPDGDLPATDLAVAMDAGLLPFPKLQRRGEAISQYLRRLRLWREMSHAFETKSKRLRPYSFRNSYSVRAHLRGLPGASVAMAMGHSELTHSSHYVTATTETTAQVFDRILGAS